MICNFALNTTSTIQSFITRNGEPITVYPHQALETVQIHGDFSDILTPIDSFLNHLDKRKIKRFYMARSYAMGDILILIPIVRALRKQGYSVYLRTTKTWKPLLDLLDIEMQITEQNHYPIDWGINLDGTLEADHSRPMLSGMHRCDIYAEALGMKKIKRLDWSLDFKKLPKVNIEKNYIVMQSAGSTRMKRLPLNSINYIRKRFKEKEINMIMIGEENRRSIEELFAIIRGAKCLITMDSAPLWISHFVKTPIIALLGPTRPHERLTYHPLWPIGAVGIRLNRYLDPPCESCFEDTRRCNDRMDCLRIAPEKIFELIELHMLKFWEN